MQLEEEKAKQARAKAANATGGEPDDADLLARIEVVREGIYRRLKLPATWADLDDEQVRSDVLLQSTKYPSAFFSSLLRPIPAIHGRDLGTSRCSMLWSASIDRSARELCSAAPP